MPVPDGLSRKWAANDLFTAHEIYYHRKRLYFSERVHSIRIQQQMASNDYHFITHWRVRGTVEEVADVLGEPLELPRWWPSVYLDVQEVQPGDAHHVGRVVKLYTKGWLPYTLRWQFRITASDYPHGFALEAWGDLTGRGIWKLAQDGELLPGAVDYAKLPSVIFIVVVA